MSRRGADSVYRHSQRLQFLALGKDKESANSTPGALYLRRTTDSYFSEKTIEYPIARDGLAQREVNHGVPQESVFGLLLEQRVQLQSALSVTSFPHVICYADDTMIIAGERN